MNDIIDVNEEAILNNCTLPSEPREDSFVNSFHGTIKASKSGEVIEEAGNIWIFVQCCK